MKYVKIKSIDHLKKILKNGETKDFFISFGVARSSKEISYDGKYFYVLNYIDNTEQMLTEKELSDDNLTNIGSAIQKGSFYQNP